MNANFLDAYIEYIANDERRFMIIQNCILLNGDIRNEVRHAIDNDIPIKKLDCYGELIEAARQEFKMQMEEDSMIDYPNKYDFCFEENGPASVDEEIYEAYTRNYLKEFSYADIVNIFIEDPGDMERFKRKLIGTPIGSMPEILNIDEEGYRKVKYIITFATDDGIITDVKIETFTLEHGAWVNEDIYPDYELINKYIDSITDR